MYLFFDTETNGLPINYKAPLSELDNWPRLVQLAWIFFDSSGNKIARNNHIILPVGFTISSESASVHGITTERAISEGVELMEVLNEFQSFCAQASTLVAHNMRFDEKILGAEYLRKKLPNPLEPLNKRCTMLESTDFVAIKNAHGYKWPTLKELHIKLFGSDFDGAHNAAADVEATARCFWELKRRGLI
jgi:DNA polymerase III epsilon subunit-like protein